MWERRLCSVLSLRCGTSGCTAEGIDRPSPRWTLPQWHRQRTRLPSGREMASRRHEVRKIQDGKPHYLSNYDSSFVVFMFLTSIKAHCQSIRNQSTSICISDSVTPYERRPFPLPSAGAWMAFQRPLWAHALPPPMYTILGTYHKKLSDRQMCFWGKRKGNAWIPRSTLLLHSS